MNDKFTWPAYPETVEEFEALMRAVDAALSSEGLKPFQRPLNVPRKFWEAFKWGGNVLPDRQLAQEPGFTGDVLMAKAHEWYEQSYGRKLDADFAFGYAPYRLGNAIWRIRAGLTRGEVALFIDRNVERGGPAIVLGTQGRPAIFNVLAAVEGLPHGLAQRLTDRALDEYADFYVYLLKTLAWRDRLPGDELFRVARADYDQSTADLLAHRYGQSRWGAQQAVEKTIKGILSIAGTKFPRDRSGHDVLLLADLLARHHDVRLEAAALKTVSCSASVRYGEVVSSESDAYDANHAALHVLEQLSAAENVSRLLASGRARQ